LARDPDAFDRVARPQPACNLVLSLKKTGVWLVVRSVRWRVVWARLLRHRPTYRFWRPKVFSADAFFFAHRAAARPLQLESTATRYVSLVVAETERESAILIGTRRYRLATDRGELRPLTTRNFFAPLVPGSLDPFQSLACACSEDLSVYRARHSFGRRQNCSVLASGLGPELGRDWRAQRLRLIRATGADPVTETRRFARAGAGSRIGAQ